MRLLLVTQDFPPSVGGIQTYCRELASRLAAMCRELEVVAPAMPGDRALDRTLPFRVHRLPVRSDRGAMAAASALAVPAVCRSGRFDTTFHAQWNTAHGGLVARRLGLVDRVVAAAHGRELLLGLMRPPVATLYDRLRRSVLPRIDRFAAVSRYTARLLERAGVERDRIAVVPNGVDPQRFANADGRAWRERNRFDGSPLLLTLCRLVPRKGIDTVLRALVHVQRAVPDVRYAVAGTGPDRERLESLAVRLGVRDRVHFVGHVADADVAACLAAGDVFVMPARSRPPDVEGFGLVFLEANACGRPVVGADAGGVPDAIVPGETGELVPPDDPPALAGTLIYLLKDRAYADRLGRRGRERVEQELNWDRTADALVHVLSGAPP